MSLGSYILVHCFPHLSILCPLFNLALPLARPASPNPCLFTEFPNHQQPQYHLIPLSPDGQHCTQCHCQLNCLLTLRLVHVRVVLRTAIFSIQIRLIGSHLQVLLPKPLPSVAPAHVRKSQHPPQTQTAPQWNHTGLTDPRFSIMLSTTFLVSDNPSTTLFHTCISLLSSTLRHGALPLLTRCLLACIRTQKCFHHLQGSQVPVPVSSIHHHHTQLRACTMTVHSSLHTSLRLRSPTLDSQVDLPEVRQTMTVTTMKKTMGWEASLTLDLSSRHSCKRQGNE